MVLVCNDTEGKSNLKTSFLFLMQFLLYILFGSYLKNSVRHLGYAFFRKRFFLVPIRANSKISILSRIMTTL